MTAIFIRCLFLGQELEYGANKTLDDYQLIHLSTLTMLLRLPGGENKKTLNGTIDTEQILHRDVLSTAHYPKNAEQLDKYMQLRFLYVYV